MHRPSDPHPAPPLLGITRRSLVIGFLLIPVMAIWTQYTEIVAAATDLAAMSLPIAVVFGLLVLIVANLGLKRVAPRYAFTQAELLFVFLMQTASIGISGIGMMQFLNTMVANVYHYATPENQWEQNIHPYLARWAFPDPAVLDGYFAGQSTFYDWQVVRGWLGPILVWSAFIVVLLTVMLCINTIIRRQWIERERLGFPIVAVPLELTRDGTGGALWASRALWMGFAIPAVLQTLASLNYLYPSIPHVPIKPSEPSLDLTRHFTEPPWSGVGYFTLAFYPLVIGLTYLLSLEVGFSLWFFYLFTKVQSVACVALGYRSPDASLTMQRMPYLGEQSAGAFIGLALVALYTMRTHLRDVARRAFLGDRSVHDADEPMPYRWAVFGTLVGMAALTAFGVALGMPWHIPAILFVLYFLFIITFTRIRAEAGLPWGFGPDMNPHQMVVAGGGTHAFTASGLTGFSTLMWFNLDYRCVAMPHQLEAMKLADSARLKPRHVTLVIVLATVVGALAAWWSVLTVYYHFGAATANVNDWRTHMGRVPWQTLQDWLNNPLRADAARMQGVGVGMMVTAGLMAMRQNFVWWPFHPVGYAVAGTFTMPWLWFPTLIGWLLKLLTIRYGGMKAYRRGIPFFIGLILGDYVTGSLWAIYGSVTGIATYRAFPI
ncbi:MAG TPA: DUF6785 family protein [Chthonomonadales bacterium]|nr:DUF6785 family protein [Chthonomonadales bacterium]